MKKPSKSDANRLKEESIRQEKIAALNALAARVKQIQETKIEVMRKKDEAMLVMATELISIKIDNGLSWESLAEALGGLVEQTTLFKFAMRQVWLSQNTYRLLGLSINEFRKKQGLEPIEFPRFYN